MNRPLINHGILIRTNNGYIGEINIHGIIMDIQATFWNKKINGCDVWIQRQKVKEFEEKTNTFRDYTPLPYFDCKADKTKKNDNVDYRGRFVFQGFIFDLVSWWEDKSQHQLNLAFERSKNQVILERLKEINKNK